MSAFTTKPPRILRVRHLEHSPLVEDLVDQYGLYIAQYLLHVVLVIGMVASVQS
jgi:hypothetical protein